jgi:hypothetical protein
MEVPMVDIPRERWMSFMKKFSRRHLCHTATVKTTTAGSSVATQVRGLPLAGVATTLDESGQPRIAIEVFNGTTTKVRQIIDGPARIMFGRTRGTGDELVIKAANSTTRVRCSAA